MVPPVWSDEYKGVIGMINMASGNGKAATFITTRTLIPFLKGKTNIQIVKNQTSLSGPPELHRNRMIADENILKLGSMVVNKTTVSKNITVILGPSGSGKTCLAAEFYSSFPSSKKFWLDCLDFRLAKEYFKKVQDFSEYDLIVIDNLTSDHPLIKDNWLDRTPANILVILSNSEIIEDLYLKYGIHNYKEKIFELNGFSDEKAFEYFRKLVRMDLATDDQLKSLAKLTKGIPILIKILATIIEEEQEDILQEIKKSYLVYYQIHNEALKQSY